MVLGATIALSRCWVRLNERAASAAERCTYIYILTCACTSQRCGRPHRSSFGYSSGPECATIAAGEFGVRRRPQCVHRVTYTRLTGTDISDKKRLHQYAAPAKNILFLARLEFLRKAGCVPYYFQHKRGHVIILVLNSSLKFVTLNKFLRAVAYFTLDTRRPPTTDTPVFFLTFTVFHGRQLRGATGGKRSDGRLLLPRLFTINRMILSYRILVWNALVWPCIRSCLMLVFR